MLLIAATGFGIWASRAQHPSAAVAQAASGDPLDHICDAVNAAPLTALFLAPDWSEHGTMRDRADDTKFPAQYRVFCRLRMFLEPGGVPSGYQADPPNEFQTYLQVTVSRFADVARAQREMSVPTESRYSFVDEKQTTRSDVAELGEQAQFVESRSQSGLPYKAIVARHGRHVIIVDVDGMFPSLTWESATARRALLDIARPVYALLPA
ncbi:hypothetical protein [Virgisporangium aliadipatigenens]|uniref:hypothetical protein n=1 Tax=Virgisporangium aliadipatigenens TaxID=741659 RepID=UPI001942A9AB|nr:hypothetical protein [Virgisporangium aliadipatigenens]